MSSIKVVEGGVTVPKGFYASSVSAEIKYKNREDMALVYSEEKCVSAGVYTSNVVKAAPVIWDKNITDTDTKVRAVVINSGIANACTGEKGLEICKKTGEAVAGITGDTPESVLVASTGVIGMQIPVDRITAGAVKLVETKDPSVEAGTRASKAIMTTDTVNKEIATEFTVGGKTAHMGAMTKGAGMIHPNMCTMLCFVTTDAAIDKKLMQEALSEIVKDTFNMISVDGDTSTNDTLVILSNGLAGNDVITEKNDDYNTFKENLFYICRDLAMRMAGDGEGATALFEAQVKNAKTKEDAKLMARSVVSSSLSKAAIFGHDANFGRFLCAMGYSGADFDQNDVELTFVSDRGQMKVFDHGEPLSLDEEKATDILSSKKVTILINMNEGSEEATAWGCDLSYDYVKINADYRS